MYKFAFVLLLFCCFPLYPPLFNQLFLPPKSHCIFIFEFHTFTICFHRGIICNITLSSVISSIIYSLSSVVSSNTCILSSVKSSNTFIQSSVISSQYLKSISSHCDIIQYQNPINITQYVPAVEICDEVGSLQSAINVYLKKLLRHVYWKNMATLCT